MIGRAAALALLAGAAAAEAQDVEADPDLIGAVEAGIFCTEETGQRAEAPGTVAGFVSLVDGIALRARTAVVPAAPGLTFGFRATALADAPGAVQILRHPPFPGLGATEQTTDAPLRRGAARAGFYSFDHAYERVAGPWTFEIRDGGRSVLRASFRVVAPEEAPHLLGLCDGPPALSRAPLTPQAPAGSG